MHLMQEDSSNVKNAQVPAISKNSLLLPPKDSFHRKPRREWTPQKDRKLAEGVKLFKNWGQVSQHVKTRSPDQCAHRYSASAKMNPCLRFGHWMPDEIERLKTAMSTYEAYRNKWSAISKMVKTRNRKQCYRWWLDHRKASSKLPWGKQDDALLKILFEQYGANWGAMQKFVQGRNSSDIKSRWKYLLRSPQSSDESAQNPPITVQEAFLRSRRWSTSRFLLSTSLRSIFC